jgi:hypothetical protein
MIVRSLTSPQSAIRMLWSFRDPSVGIIVVSWPIHCHSVKIGTYIICQNGTLAFLGFSENFFLRDNMEPRGLSRMWMRARLPQ